jgi:hypothetical protein
MASPGPRRRSSERLRTGHAEGEVTLTIMRLAVLGQLGEQAGGKYVLAKPGQG